MINEKVQVMHFNCANCGKYTPVDKDNVRSLDEASGKEEIGRVRMDQSGEWIIVFNRSKAGAPINVETCPHCNMPMYNQTPQDYDTTID